MPTVSTKVVPTGGTIVLNITLSPGLDINTAQITINRYIGNLLNPPTVIYTGVCTPVFIDDGEALPNYLDFGTTYLYTVTDFLGTATTDGITPAAQLAVTSSYLDKLLFRLFSAGMNALVLPAGFLGYPPGSGSRTGRKKIRVLQEMPTNGSDILPLVVMNLDLEQQEALEIGHAVNTSQTNLWTIPSVVFRRYSITVLCETSEERNFYKDACIGVLYTMMQGLVEIGQELSYKYQVAQTQVTDGDKSPGFFESEMMLDIQGIFNVSVQTNYPVISAIAPDIAMDVPPDPFVFVAASASTQLVGGISFPSSVIVVLNTGEFPAAGTLIVGQPGNYATVTYTGVTATSFTGCSTDDDQFFANGTAVSYLRLED